jgi:hypothetical protein
MKLVEKIKDDGHKIFKDKYFTSPKLSNPLNQRNQTLWL